MNIIPRHNYVWWLKYFALCVVVGILSTIINKAILGDEGLL